MQDAVVKQDAVEQFICVNKSRTWRSALTINKPYDLSRPFTDRVSGDSMVKVKCDDGIMRTYRANRFIKVKLEVQLEAQLA